VRPPQGAIPHNLNPVEFFFPFVYDQNVIDLHIHTCASSDGQHLPREIFEMARRKGLREIAFADHNSVAHVEEGFRLSKEFGIEFISAMELNTFHAGLDLHLLAYFVDPRNPLLQNWLSGIQEKKISQAKLRIAKLNDLGFFFTEEDLKKYAQDRLPTGASFLDAILSRRENLDDPRLQPYIRGDRSASPYVNFYRDFLRGGKPASVPIEELSTPEAICKIKELGGVAILAHPSDTREEIIRDLVTRGLEGLEVYTPYHRPQEREAFKRFALQHGLLITAGSDFHGHAVKPDVSLGDVDGSHEDLVVRLKEYHQRKR
jgi:predicted metal-dependent phosphoesterase TrpH